MRATIESRGQVSTIDEPVSETRLQRRSAMQAIPVEALDYHLFAPRRAHDPVLESAYEVWRDGWKATLHELDGVATLHSDEFDRQDEVGVLCLGGRCISVTGLRWLNLALTRAREDSYFEHWPEDAVAALGHRLVGITNNTIVHPEWRRTVIEPPTGSGGEPVRLAFATIALSLRRFVSSAAESVIALARNDRAMHMAAVSMGGRKVGQITLHGIETDVMVASRDEVRVRGPVIDHLWARRHQG